MLQPEEIFRSIPITSDAGGRILNQVLRGLAIEYKHTSTSIHLASPDMELVDSLLLALDQIVKTQQAIRNHLSNESARAEAPYLLAELTTEARVLRDSLWPAHYRSCEALTRVLDTLELAQHSLSDATTTRFNVV
ncbi:MAG TPA: hypothetical protein VHS05_31875 [Pyrinomonadaceae bacterium]|jgi:hypothetical protein|nr:hypothetical protein [Pyrinomonadaceae bacterium]